MAFCKECGADLQGAKFCPACGTAAKDILIQQRESVLSADATLRQASIDECNKMIQYFDQTTKTWQEYERVTKLVNLGRSHLHCMLLFGSIIWLALGVFVCFVGEFMLNEGANIVQAYIVIVGFMLLLFGVPPALLMWGYIALHKRSKRKYQELLTQRAVLADEIIDHYVAYGYCHVGLQYTRVNTLRDILEQLELGRCKTIADAINIILDDAYKTHMRQQGEAILAAANRAADAAEEAAIAARANLLLNLSDHF